MKTPMGREIDQVVSVQVAADHLGVVRSRVTQLLRKGQLAGKKSGYVWLVSGHSICLRQQALLRGE